jgi:hypothetical protein
MRKRGRQLTLVDFTPIGTSTPTSTMTDIVTSVTASKQRVSHASERYDIASASSPTRRGFQVFDKKAVPTLDKFSGHDA